MGKGGARVERRPFFVQGMKVQFALIAALMAAMPMPAPAAQNPGGAPAPAAEGSHSATPADSPFSPSPLAGLISSDTVWSGIVPVNGKIQILAGATLTIQPGTQVRFAVASTRTDTAEDRIFVQPGGTLIARGTETQPIVFASATPGLKWYGIELHSGHDQDAFAHCRIRDSINGIACVSTSPTIEDCVFESNRQGVSLWRQAQPLLRRCRFLRNAVGVWASMQSAPTVTSCEIEASGEIGVSVEAGCGGVIEKTLFQGNKIGIQKRGGGSFLATENRFAANEVGVFIDREGATAELRANEFTDNKEAVRVATKAAPLVSRNMFKGNTAALQFESRAQGSVSHNDFTANGTGIRLSKTSNPEIVLNDFSGNETALLCEYSSYPVIANNNFRGNNTDIQAGENQSFAWTRSVWPAAEWANWAQNYGENKILARNNYWGEENTRALLAGAKEIKTLMDFRRSAEITVSGKAYRRDEVDFQPFSPTPIGDAGSAGPEPGTRGP